METKVMPLPRVKATARIQLTVEIKATSPWGHDCLIGQLYDQAAKEAVETLTCLFRANAAAAKIVGEPKVIGVLTESES